jgi:predicted nucleotidyltransferase
MRSKEGTVLELFLNNPSKEWHFEDMIKTTKMARSKLDSWLKKFLDDGLIKRVKPKSKMPYYISKFTSIEYKGIKRIYGLRKLYECGLIGHLSQLDATVILFGSFARTDWHKESDVDIFIYGNIDGLKLLEYELKLKREIQIFHCANNDDLQRLGHALIKNIIKGDLIKGDLDFIEVSYA